MNPGTEWKWALACVALLVGCAQPKRPMTAEEEAYQRHLDEILAKHAAERVPVLPVSISCYGHGAGYIYSFYVQEPVVGQLSRGMVWGGSGNCGTVIAGYPLPKTWTPGMKVKVRWNRPIKGEDNWIEKTTTILPYDRPNMLIVHFFAHDEVRVVVSNYWPESPYHPIPPTAIEPPQELE